MANIIPIIVAGVGIPLASAWMANRFPQSMGEALGEKGKAIAITSVVGIAVAGLAIASVESSVPAKVIEPSQIHTPMSVSSVTAQLGRYAGGVNYPGQMYGSQNADGSLVFVD